MIGLNDIANTKAGYGLVSLVEKESNMINAGSFSLLEVGVDCLNGLLGKGEFTYFLPLAEYSYLGAWVKLKVLDFEVDQLLGANAGGVEDGEKSTVATSQECLGIGGIEKCLNFCAGKTNGGSMCGLLEIDRTDLLT